MSWLGIEAHWWWLAGGLLLAAAEALVPGVFLIWLAFAALVTGLVAWLVPIGLAAQVILFAELALVSVLVARRWLRYDPTQQAAADPLLNDFGARLIGDTVVVTQAISGGEGRVRRGDSEWLARGPDSAPGTRLRIAGREGTVLLLETLE